MRNRGREPLEAFFSPEHLQAYRDLHDRFPLWSGDWDERILRFPESKRWSASSRVWEETQGLLKNLAGVEFPNEPDEAQVAEPVLVFFEADEEARADVQVRSREFEPPALRTLLAAIDYAMQPWRVKENGHWSIAERSGRTEALIADLGKLLRSRSAAHPTAMGLWTRFHRVMHKRNRPELEKAVYELERYWVAIGEEAGIIPKLQGGSRCALPDVFLADLQGEARGLVKGIVEFSPSEEDMELIRERLGGWETHLTDYEREHLRRLRPQTAADAAGDGSLYESKRQEYLARVDERMDTLGWARRLWFPMLSQDEIALILERTRGSLNPRTIDAAATSLLADRLPIERSTVLNRISRDRHR
jgi:hypothetical protein